MKIKVKKPMNIHYDEEGDFLEITIANPPKKSYCEDVNNDIFIRKDEKTDEIIGVGISNFKKHTENFKEVQLDIPVQIKFERPEDII